MSGGYDVAALLALDALEADEQADAELSIGTFPAGFATASASLAESVTERPPPDLRVAVLARASSRRAPGRPVGAPGACEPADAFARTVADLAELLAALTHRQWSAPAHAEHGTVRAVVAHLIGMERLSIRWLDGEDVPPLPDHLAATRPVVTELSEAGPRDLAREWHRAARGVAAAAARGDQGRLVTFHDLRLPIGAFLTARTFELWSHGMDIALATGRPVPTLDDQRMTLLSRELMAVVPHALAHRGTTAPGRSVRFVLTGRSGGAYTVPLAPGHRPGDPDAIVIAHTMDLCRVAARRLPADRLDFVVDGDRELARLVLAGLDAFARD